MHEAMLASSKPLKWLMEAVSNDQWWLEPKLDGIRTLVEVRDGRLTWHNRSGELLTKPVPEVSAALPDMTLDGELVDGVLWAFDVTSHLGEDLKAVSLQERRATLEHVVKQADCDTLRITEVAWDHRTKRDMAERAYLENWEGLMAKRIDSSYQPGRGMSMVKLKLTKTADLMIGEVGIDGKENASLLAINDGRWVEIGRCSTVGKPPLSPGQIVEVRYLHTGVGGRLVQPRLVRIRHDKRPEECGIPQ